MRGVERLGTRIPGVWTAAQPLLAGAGRLRRGKLGAQDAGDGRLRRLVIEIAGREVARQQAQLMIVDPAALPKGEECHRVAVRRARAVGKRDEEERAALGGVGGEIAVEKRRRFRDARLRELDPGETAGKFGDIGRERLPGGGGRGDQEQGAGQGGGFHVADDSMAPLARETSPVNGSPGRAGPGGHRRKAQAGGKLLGKRVDATRRRGQESRRLMRCPSLSPLRWKFALLAWSVLAAVASALPGGDHHTWKSMKDWQGDQGHWLELLPPHLEYSEVRIKRGDDPRWAQTTWDDTRWGHHGYFVPVLQGVMWLRFRVRDLSAPLPPTLYLVLSAAQEIYWDGTLVGKSGVPGNDETTEQAGRVRNYYSIPEALRTPGEHVIALRLSTHRQLATTRSGTLLFFLTTPAQLEIARWRFLAAPVMQVGAMALFGLAAMVMWLVAARRRALLWFVGLCVGCITIQGGLIVEYTVSRLYDTRFAFYGLLCTACAAMSLVALVAQQLGLPRVRWVLGGLVLAYTLVVNGTGAPWGSRPYTLMTLGLLAALGYTIVGLGQKRRGAKIAFAGVLLTVVLNLRSPLDFMRSDMLVGLLPTELAMFALIALDLRDERRRARDAQLTAARLEIELLKQNLQPHFLMNTLTALAQTMQENPDRAMALIDDLAGEIRMLAGMAAEKHVALGRELELCRAHLRVMRARTDVEWELQVEGIDEAARVPPALFLTLIENGFSHQRAERHAARFRLRSRAEGVGIRYVFFSPGGVIAEPTRVEGGTGLRYVRARLEESFPGGWGLSHGPSEGGWETIVDLRAGAAGRDTR